MKHITNILTLRNLGNKLIVSTALILLVACQHHKPAETKTSLIKKDTLITTKSSPYSLDMVVNQKDLACYMPLKEGIGDTAHYHGKVYGFCSRECKKEFLSRPSYYLKD